MTLHRIAAAAAFALALAAPARAELILVAGEGPATLASNHYGFSGTYHDLNGRNGASEIVAHPGGGPVAFLYVFNADTTISTYFDAKAGPYDGADDTQVGVLNLESSVVHSLALGARNVSDIFGFDGDGISSSSFKAPSNALDTSYGKYGGPMTFFTGINKSLSAGTANFIGGLAADGGTTYFSLENAPVMGSISPTNPGSPVVPEPSSLAMIGIAAATLAGLRRLIRGEATS